MFTKQIHNDVKNALDGMNLLVAKSQFRNFYIIFVLCLSRCLLTHNFRRKKNFHFHFPVPSIVARHSAENTRPHVLGWIAHNSFWVFIHITGLYEDKLRRLPCWFLEFNCATTPYEVFQHFWCGKNWKENGRNSNLFQWTFSRLKLNIRWTCGYVAAYIAISHSKPYVIIDLLPYITYWNDTT